ncbi:MAG: hypothetical protein AAF799_13560 [Myxococcota bacterium]
MPWIRVLSLSIAALALGAGCQNNTIQLEFDTDGNPPMTDDSTGDDDGSMTTTLTTAAESSTGAPVGSSTYLLAVSTPLDPSLPFQGLVTITEQAGTIDLSVQWLSLDIGSRTSPRELVGTVYTYSIPIDDTGFIYWDAGLIDIPAAANPITGQDVTTSFLAGATPIGDPAYCGEVAGDIVTPAPLSLAGSTHAMTEVAGTANLPTDFLSFCP